MAGPWWMEHVARLIAGPPLHTLSPGSLWNLAERLQFVRENVEPALLALDVAVVAGAQECWQAFEVRETTVAQALRRAVDRETAALRSGGRTPSEFRTHWEGLGFAPTGDGASTPADDYLDALCNVSRLTLGEELPAMGLPNLSSRAERISDFLSAFRPGPDEVVYDLGSGSGKVALTVAASSDCRVRGVELGARYITAARSAAGALGLTRLEFLHADVRDVDLSEGTLFYLYYPFRDDVARATAEVLGALARTKRISLYVYGPQNGFREHFDAQVSAGALRLHGRHGEFQEVLLLGSALH